MSDSFTSLSDLKDLIQTTEELILSEEVIGQANFNSLRLLLPRLTDFRLTSAQIIQEGDNHLKFEASLMHVDQVEATFYLFDLGPEPERHVIFHFQTASGQSVSAYVFLSQYSLDADEPLPESEELAPYSPILELIQNVQFLPQEESAVILFSSLDLSSPPPDKLNFLDSLGDLFTPTEIEIGLNFQTQVTLEDHLNDFLDTMLGGSFTEADVWMGRIHAAGEMPLFTIRQRNAPGKTKRLIDLEEFNFTLDLILPDWRLVLPLTDEAKVAPELTVKGTASFSEAEGFAIQADVDLYYQVLSLSFSQFPSLRRVLSLVDPEIADEFFPEALSSMLDVTLSTLGIAIDLPQSDIVHIDLQVIKEDQLRLLSFSADNGPEDNGLAIEPMLELRLSSPFDNAYRSITGRVQGRWHLGQTEFDTQISIPHYVFSVRMVENQTVENQTVDNNALFNQILPDIHDLPPLSFSTVEFNGDLLTKNIFALLKAPGAGDDWTVDIGGQELRLEDIELGVTFAEGSLEECEVTGRLALSGAQFQITSSFDTDQGFSFYCGSDFGETLSLGDLANDLLSDLALPANLPTVNLTDLVFSATPKLGTYALSGQSSDAWQINSDVPFEVAIDRFSMSKGKDLPPGGALNLTLPIRWTDTETDQETEIELYLSADKEGSDDTPWQFSGQTGQNQGIPVKGLVGWTRDQFSTDAWLPAEIEGLQADRLSVQFTSDGALFRFICETSLDINKASLPLSLEIALDLDKKGRYQKKFGGTIEINEVTLDTEFIRSGEGESMLIARSTQAEDQAIQLSEFLSGILPDDLMTIAPKIEVSIHKTIFVYQKSEARPSTVLFGLKPGEGIEFSEIELVGDYLVGLSLSLQMLIASQNLTSAQAATINAQLDGAFPDLPTAADNQQVVISKGLNFAGELGAEANSRAARLFSSDLTLTTPLAEPAPQPEGSERESLPEENEPIVAPLTWLPVEKTIGPLYFDRLGVKYNPGDHPTLLLALDASLTLGPLTLTINELSAVSPLTNFTPAFVLNGFGIGMEQGALEISGAFVRQTTTVNGTDITEFRGGALIKSKTFGITAAGAFAFDDEMLSAFLYGILDKALGGPPFFYVTGLALGFGFNRDLLIPDINGVETFPLVQAATSTTPPASPDDVLKLFGEIKPDPIRPKPQAYWVAAGLKFTSFGIINSFALLIVRFGRELDLVVLGKSTLELPKKPGKGAEPYVHAEIVFKVSYKPGTGLVAADGLLTSNSYVIDPACRLSGGFAFYLWTGDDHSGDFVLSIGGYHPRFLKPAHYPAVPRLGINWPVDNKISIKGQAYFAITPAVAMAGGRLEATYQDGDLTASLTAYADFTIGWEPFTYDVQIGIGIFVRYETFIETIETSLQADMHIWGPKTSGTVTITWTVISKTVNFGEADGYHSFLTDKSAIDWDTFRDQFLPAKEEIGRVQIEGGLLEELGGEWVVEPDQLSLAIESALPITQIKSGSQELAEGEPFWIRPMGGIRIDDSTLEFSAALLDEDGDVVKDIAFAPQTADLAETEDTWRFKRRQRPVPPALWGEGSGPDNDTAPSSRTEIPTALIGLTQLSPPPGRLGLATPPMGDNPLELNVFAHTTAATKRVSLNAMLDGFVGGQRENLTAEFIFDKIKSTANGQTRDLRGEILQAARHDFDFSLTKGGDGTQATLVKVGTGEAVSPFQAPPMLGHLGSKGSRPASTVTVAPPMILPDLSLEELIYVITLLASFDFYPAGAAPTAENETEKGVQVHFPEGDGLHHVKQPRESVDGDGPPVVPMAMMSAAGGESPPAAPVEIELQPLKIGRTSLFKVESKERAPSRVVSLVPEEVQGGPAPIAYRVVTLDRYSRLTSDDIQSSGAYDLPAGARYVAVQGVASGGTDRARIAEGWHGSSSLLLVRPQMLLGDRVIIEPQIGQSVHYRGRSYGFGVLSGEQMARGNVIRQKDGALIPGRVKTTLPLPAGDDNDPLTIVILAVPDFASELPLEAPVIEVIEKNGPRRSRTRSLRRPGDRAERNEEHLFVVQLPRRRLLLDKQNRFTVDIDIRTPYTLNGVLAVDADAATVRNEWGRFRLDPLVSPLAEKGEEMPLKLVIEEGES
jgi:hypothetical protein